MALRPKLVALDTNVLLHLAEDYAPAHNLVLTLVRRGFTPVVTQTVVHELGYFSHDEPHTQRGKSATIALQNMRTWGVQPWGLKPVGNGICDIIAEVIANRDLLPADEKNDAYLFIESGFIHAAMLVTWDAHLLDASNDKLNEVLKSFDLAPVQIVHPRVILGY